MKVFILYLSALRLIQAKEILMTCGPDKFSCDSDLSFGTSIRCIPNRWLCDGSPDCEDHTDELKQNCPQTTTVAPTNCKSSQFQCENGICIPHRWTCDGRDDCGDNSDEKERDCVISCKEHEFMCGTEQCITDLWRCDGHMDCVDGSDELNCTSPLPSVTGPSATMFQCRDGYNAPIAWRCDGDPDCQHGEDEEDCGDIVASTEIKNSKSKKKVSIRCRSNEFLCPNSYSSCILATWLCDGTEDCPNGEDERNCTKINCNEKTQFACKDGKQCVNLQLVCNGLAHCNDHSDELDCSQTATALSPKVPDSKKVPDSDKSGAVTKVPDLIESTTQPKCDSETEFQCHNGKCIPKSFVCDTYTNCPNREDESRELCGINECERNNGGCDQKCIDTKSGHECKCGRGYTLVGKYSCVDIDECKENAGSCSQLCTNTKGSFHCSCLPGYARELSNYTRCKASEGEVYLLFSHSYDIRSLRLRDKDMTSVVQHTRRAIALDYSFEEGKILWSDKKEKRIYRAPLENTEDREVLVEGEEVSADGLVVDWIHNHIYYTDTEKSTIMLLSWDAQHVKTIVSEEVGHPRAIVVSPNNGYIYWTDWGIEPKIERSSLNGDNRIAIVTQPHVVWPNGLVIDHSTEKIYWCDGRLRTISSSNLDGTNTQVILYSPFFLRQPFSISVFEDRLYWADWSQVALFSADKFTGTNIKNISAGHLLESPKVVHVFHQYRQPKSINVCKDHSCSHFCLRSSIGEAVCECSDGFLLQEDKLSCISEALIRRRAFVNHTRVAKENSQVLKEKLVQNEVVFEQSESKVGFIVGSFVGILVGVALIVGIYIGWTKSRSKPIQRIRFHNSVYRKTTADESDGLGYVIDQDQLFCSQAARMTRIEQQLTDDDHAPLTSNQEDDRYLV